MTLKYLLHREIQYAPCVFVVLHADLLLMVLMGSSSADRIWEYHGDIHVQNYTGTYGDLIHQNCILPRIEAGVLIQ